MMARFCRYVDKVFQFGEQIKTLSDARPHPRIPTAAIFASAWTLLATERGSLNRLEKEVRIPARLQGVVGPQAPSADTIGRVYALMESQQLRQMLCTINHQARRNKALGGGDLMFVAVDGRLAGLLAVADPIKPTTPEAIRALHDKGLKVVMLTGDGRATAEAVARTLGIDQVIAEVLPDQKAATITGLKAEGRRVAMAGDGINDAPALAAADVGIAMGGGTDVAMHAAGITLMRGDPRLVPAALDIARRTYGKIRQNLFWAFIYNVIGIPVAAGVLYPSLGLRLTPAMAAAAMAVSSVSVLFNSLRLRSFR